MQLLRGPPTLVVAFGPTGAVTVLMRFHAHLLHSFRKATHQSIDNELFDALPGEKPLHDLPNVLGHAHTTSPMFSRVARTVTVRFPRWSVRISNRTSSVESTFATSMPPSTPISATRIGTSG